MNGCESIREAARGIPVCLETDVAVVGESDSPSVAYRLNTEELKIELDELVVGHGIVPFLHTFYAAPVMESGSLAAIVIENKNGRQAIRARQFVDATGDGDLARGAVMAARGPSAAHDLREDHGARGPWRFRLAGRGTRPWG